MYELNTTPDPYNPNTSNYPYQNPYGSTNPGDPTMAGSFPTYPYTTQYPYQPPQNYPPPPQKKKWYESNGGIILLLFLFFPVGLIFMWLYATWSPKAKWIVTGILAFCVMMGGINNAVADPSTATSSTLQPTEIAQVTPTRVPTVNNPTVKPTHAPTPTPAPTTVPTQQNQPTQPPVNQPPPPPPPPSCNGTEIDGACYNTDANGGLLVYSPPSTFCDYFICVSTFWTATRGYVAECSDGHYTHSGGVSGACSRNGGVMAPVYRH